VYLGSSRSGVGSFQESDISNTKQENMKMGKFPILAAVEVAKHRFPVLHKRLENSAEQSC
jgi:hypothetical protein